MKSAKVTSSEIPFELIQNILSRLPTKKSAQFRLVCNAWNHFIISNEYVKMRHYKPLLFLGKYRKSRRNDFFLLDIDETRVLDNTGNLDANVDPESNAVISFETEIFTRNSRNPDRKVPVRSATIANECNGIICMKPSTDWGSFIMYNPLTSQQRLVNNTRKRDHFLYDFFLGYCPESHKFKVLRILAKYDGDNRVVEIQTVDTDNDEWRSLSNTNCRYRRHCSKVSLGGSFHWYSYLEDRNNIWSFNFKNGYERFSPLALPANAHMSPSADVNVFGDKISYTCSSETMVGYTDIWVMEEYGEENSWVKKFVIKNDVVGESDGLSIPLMQWQREILVFRGYFPKLYDLDSQTYRPVKQLGVSNYNMKIQRNSFDFVSCNPTFSKLPVLNTPDEAQGNEERRLV